MTLSEIRAPADDTVGAVVVLDDLAVTQHRGWIIS